MTSLEIASRAVATRWSPGHSNVIMAGEGANSGVPDHRQLNIVQGLLYTRLVPTQRLPELYANTVSSNPDFQSTKIMTTSVWYCERLRVCGVTDWQRQH